MHIVTMVCTLLTVYGHKILDVTSIRGFLKSTRPRRGLKLPQLSHFNRSILQTAGPGVRIDQNYFENAYEEQKISLPRNK